MTSSEITNIALFGIFQSCKKTRFAKEPDYNEVLNQISSALDVPQSEKLMTDIKAFFPRYVEYVKNSRSLSSCSRNLDEKVVLYRHNYVPKLRRPLEEVGDRQQRRRMGNFMELSKAQAEVENTSPNKMFAFGLKNKYLLSLEILVHFTK